MNHVWSYTSYSTVGTLWWSWRHKDIPPMFEVMSMMWDMKLGFGRPNLVTKKAMAAFISSLWSSIWIVRPLIIALLYMGLRNVSIEPSISDRRDTTTANIVIGSMFGEGRHKSWLDICNYIDYIKGMWMALIRRTWCQPFKQIPLVPIPFISDIWINYRHISLEVRLGGWFASFESHYCLQPWYVVKTYVDYHMHRTFRCIT